MQKKLFKILYMFLIFIILITEDVLAYEKCGFISPTKNLDIKFKMEVPDYIKENYRGFNLNIVIPDTDGTQDTKYINFRNIENLEGGVQNINKSNIEFTQSNGITNPQIYVDNIDINNIYLNLTLKTDYKIDMYNYKNAVNSEKYIMVHFELIANEKRNVSIVSENGLIEYTWEYVNEKVLKSYTSEIPTNNDFSNENNFKGILPIKLKLINMAEVF